MKLAAVASHSLDTLRALSRSQALDALGMPEDCGVGEAAAPPVEESELMTQVPYFTAAHHGLRVCHDDK